MDRDDLYYLGYISKTRGLNGEVSVVLDVDEPSAYTELESVYVEIQQEPVPFFIDAFQLAKRNLANIKFEDIDSEEAASKLVKSRLWLPLDFLPPLEGNKFYFHEIVGFTVIDQNHGELGPVETVLDYPGNPLIQVMKAFREILVPINDEVLLEVDRDSKTIQVSMPDGLLEIYLGRQDDEERDE